MCRHCWDEEYGMLQPTYSAWLGVYVDPLHLLASARTHNAISDARHMLRLVAVRSGAMRTQRQELSGIFALPLEMLQEIESWLFDVNYVDFHPCRALLDDHVEIRGKKYVPECSRCTKKSVAQRKMQGKVEVAAAPNSERINCEKLLSCALCAARKAKGLSGISTELINAHCDAERTEDGIFQASCDYAGCECCSDPCPRGRVHAEVRVDYMRFLSGLEPDAWKEIDKALSTWALKIVSTPMMDCHEDYDPDEKTSCHFGLGELAAWGIGVGLKQGTERAHETEYAASDTTTYDVNVSPEAHQAVADACAAMARGLRLQLRADLRGSAGPADWPLVEDGSSTIALTLDLPVRPPARDGKVLFKRPPPPVRAAVHFEVERDLSMFGH